MFRRNKGRPQFCQVRRFFLDIPVNSWFPRDGGDIHVAIDATFSQRHNVAAGDSPWFYEPKYFIPKAMVDDMGARITAARKTPPRHHHSGVPEAALDECEKSYEAADEKKEKTADDSKR